MKICRERLPSILLTLEYAPLLPQGEGWDEGIQISFFPVLIFPRQPLPALPYLLHPCSRHPTLSRWRGLYTA